MEYSYSQLQSRDEGKLRELLNLFGEVFEENSTYRNSQPSTTYLERFLSEPSHIVLVATDENRKIVGGMVAYELQKFEQERSEIYIYDLAVSMTHQHQGIGTGLFTQLKAIAKERNAYVLFVQADKEDAGAIAFYRTLATEEIQAYNFDISV